MSNADAVLIPRKSKNPPYTIEVPGVAAKKGETKPRRSLAAKDGLITTMSPEISTVHDILKYAAKNFGNAKALGTRKVIKVHTENKKVKKIIDGKEEMIDKKWSFFELSSYEYITFTEFEQLALNLGSGLRKLGLQKYDKMHLYGSTRYECAHDVEPTGLS